jgi:hypothetical protein
MSQHYLNDYQINAYTLQFYSDFVERVYMNDFISRHLPQIRWFIRVLFAISLFYIIFEAIANEEMSLLFWIRMFFGCCFLAFVVYTSFGHYKKYFVGMTWTVMLFVIILKFIVTTSFV